MGRAHDALRARARTLAASTGRDADDLYRTLKQLERSPSARLELGLRHARLRVHGLWFEDPNDPRMAEAVRAAGGLGKFSDEVANAHDEEVDGIKLPVLSLARIADSKRAAGRTKDRLALESIADARAVLAAEKKR